MNDDVSRTGIKKSHIWFWLIVIGLFCWFVSLISEVLLPFVVGMGIAYVLDPLADMLERRGFSRNSSTIIISTVFFLMLAIVIYFTLPLLIEQISKLLTNLPKHINQLKKEYIDYFQNVSNKLNISGTETIDNIKEKLTNSSPDMLGQLADIVMKSGFSIIHFVSLLVITPVVAFYLLNDWDNIIARINELLPHKHAETIREQARKIDEKMAAFLRGTLNVIIILSIFYAITLLTVGLPYSILIAILGGVAVIVPFVGTIVSAGVALIVAYMSSDGYDLVIKVAIIFTVAQVLEGYFLTPKLVGKHIGLNPLWIIFAMMAGGAVLGFVGVLVAIPLTAALGVLLGFAVEKYKDSEFYRNDESKIINGNY